MEAFDLVVDSKRMYAVLVATSDTDKEIKDTNSLLEYMQRYSIKKGINKNVILKAFTELPSLKEEKKYIIAKGKQPVNGKNGRIVFDVDVSGKSVFKTTHADENSKVDYRKAMQTAEICSGERIGTIIPPTLGTPGYTINGRILPAKKGKDPKITLGKGVELDSDGLSIIAIQEGRPILKKSKLYVTSQYKVEGDVSFKTGNIDFDGNVYITGSVLDGFTINADNIEVCGNIGSATLNARGDIIIHGGVNGHSKGKIVAQGSLSARFLNNSKVTVSKDITVSKGIIHTKVNCLGHVNADKIRGGTIRALKGISAHTIGSITGTPTLIEPGVNYKVRELNNKLNKLDSKIEEILLFFNDNLGNRTYFQHLTTAKQQMVKDTYKEFSEIRRKHMQLMSTRTHIGNNTEDYPVDKVLISNRLHTDVTVSTQSCYREFSESFAGPICLSENIEKKSIRVDKGNFKLQKLLAAQSAEELNSLSNHSNSCPYISSRFSNERLTEINKEFRKMFDMPEFAVLAIEEDPITRMKLKKKLRSAGAGSIEILNDRNALRFSLFEYTGKNVIIICNTRDGVEKTADFISRLTSESSKYFGIILADSICSTLKQLTENSDSIATITDEFCSDRFIEAVHNFDLPLN